MEIVFYTKPFQNYIYNHSFVTDYGTISYSSLPIIRIGKIRNDPQHNILINFNVISFVPSTNTPLTRNNIAYFNSCIRIDSFHHMLDLLPTFMMVPLNAKYSIDSNIATVLWI